MQNLGKVLQKRRQELGLSQRELADLIGVSEMSISRYERWPCDREKGARAMTSIAYRFGDFMVRVIFLAVFGVWYE